MGIVISQYKDFYEPIGVFPPNLGITVICSSCSRSFPGSFCWTWVILGSTTTRSATSPSSMASRPARWCLPGWKGREGRMDGWWSMWYVFEVYGLFSLGFRICCLKTSIVCNYVVAVLSSIIHFKLYTHVSCSMFYFIVFSYKETLWTQVISSWTVF